MRDKREKYLGLLQALENPVYIGTGGTFCVEVSVADENGITSHSFEMDPICGPYRLTGHRHAIVKAALAGQDAEEQDWDGPSWGEAVAMVEAGCRPGQTCYILQKDDRGDDLECLFCRKDAEDALLNHIAANGSEGQMESWEDMSDEDLEYWANRLGRLKNKRR